MKSKPPTKKARLDPPPPTITLEGIPACRSVSNVSPSGSTSSSLSSLLSIPPPSSSTPKAATATTASELLAAAKMAAATVKAQAAAAASVITARVSSSGPNYPQYNGIDLVELPRMNLLIMSGKSGDSKQTVVLGAEGGLSMEDIDGLQGELEILWSTLAVRIRSIKAEQTALQSAGSSGNAGGVLGEHYDPHHQEKINAVASLIDAGHGTRTSVSAAAKLVMGSQLPVTTGSNPTTPAASAGKKGAGSGTRLDKLPRKKLKGEPGSASKKGSDKPARATQNRSHSVSSDLGALDGFYKHEAPSEFWEYADNYCCQITNSHVEDLSKLIDEHGVVPENVYETPPLGKHFKDGDDASKGKGRELRSSKRIDACGPLTQRLVSALVDERVSMYNSQRNYNGGPQREDIGASSNEQGFIHRAGLIKALGLDSGANRPPMESQLRECLLDRGLLRPDDAHDPSLLNPDDEILAEIKRTQNTFRKLHQYNVDKLSDLLTKGHNELERAAFKADLVTADKEVIEAYKIIASMKIKKKPVTKKEKDQAMKALDVRNSVLQKLSPSINPDAVDPGTTLKVEV